MKQLWQLVFLLRDVALAPQTFFPPQRQPIHPFPRIGEPAPRADYLPPERPAIIAFLRHVGCPFAELTLRQMKAASERHPEIDFIAVTHGDPSGLARVCATFHGPGRVRIIADPSRQHYTAWGVGLSTFGHFAGLASLRELVALLRHGIRNRRPSGSRWQMAATFAVDATHTIRYAHLPQHAGDVPPLEPIAMHLTSLSS